MLAALRRSVIEGASCMATMSQIVNISSSRRFHNLCVDVSQALSHNVTMDSGDNKNGGPNYLRDWRERRKMTQAELAEAVGTNANMIGYLEAGERGLSAKWLRRLAPPLKITPGWLLDVDPSDVSDDMIDAWLSASDPQRRQIASIAKTIVKDGTNG